MTLAIASYALATRWDKSRSTDVSELDFGPGDVAGMDTNQISAFFPLHHDFTVQLSRVALTRLVPPSLPLPSQSSSSNAFNRN